MPPSGTWRCVDLALTDVSEERNAFIFRVGKSASEEPARVSVCSHLFTLVPRSRIFVPWRWRQYVPPKRRFTQDLHGATSQKTTFFIVTAVKTSNLTQNHIMAITPRILLWYYTMNWSRDSSVGIATSYGLDDRGVGVRVPVGARIFSSPQHPDRLWGPLNLLYNGHQERFPWG
jgi:hypothetical protein